jgi:hypothetical protein
MIQLNNSVATARYAVAADGYLCIQINGHMVLRVDERRFGDQAFLEFTFKKWVAYNYPSFWKSPVRYLFGGKMEYNYNKFK